MVAIQMYKRELESLKVAHLNDIDITDIECKVNAAIKDLQTTSGKNTINSVAQDVNMNQEKKTQKVKKIIYPVITCFTKMSR